MNDLMPPIAFTCRAEFIRNSCDIASQILAVENWRSFRGYGIIPAIRQAEFELRTPNVVGSNIRVTNQDGSSHVEEIIEWQPSQRIKLRMHKFSAPLNRLATEFEETWEFESSGQSTHVQRSFHLHARSWWTRPLLAIIAWFLKRSIVRHLRDMQSTV